MNNKGFTMIELLAIITVLTTILLISFPTIINITRQDRAKEYDDMVETLCKAGETYIYQNKDDFPSIKAGETISLSVSDLINDKLVDKNIVNPKTNKMTYYGELKFKVKNDKSLSCTYTETYAKLLEDIEPKGISIGDKYTYEVSPGVVYTFYVLSIKGNEVNLIMNSNICNDGTIPTSSKSCTCAWHADEDNNNYGPDTAITNLYNGTKGWTNVPDMIMDYEDENNKTDDTKGYTSIITSNGVTTITGKPTTNTTTVGTSSKPLKARLPKESEVTGAGCTTGAGSCPTWLMEYMTYYNVSNDKYSMNNNSEAYQKQIYGYWLLSSHSGNSDYARGVNYIGGVGNISTTYGNYGVRPVITVLKSDLSN